MKMTLLGMVQNILSALDSDEVNSISDTVEAMQVAEVVRETYDELFAALLMPTKKSLIQLEALGDLTKPNYLRIPDTVKNVDWIMYDYMGDYGTVSTNGTTDVVVPGSSYTDGLLGDYPGQIDDELSAQITYVKLEYVTPEQFMQVVLQDNIESVPSTIISDFSGAKFNIATSSNPQYWTTFDNTNIVFNAYNSAVDTTLQSNKSIAWGQYNNTFTLEDTFTPELDDDFFPLLLAEAKSTCFVNIKQVSSAKEEQRSKRQLMRMQKDFWRADQRRPYDRYPNYGRRRV